MSGGIGTFGLVGAADPRRVARAGRLDALVAFIVAMLAWPFPVLRASLPWSVHGPLILVGILVADWLIRCMALLAWGRTPMMYFLDLGLAKSGERVAFGAAMLWSAGWTVALGPTLVGLARVSHPETGLPARLSGLVTRSTG